MGSDEPMYGKWASGNCRANGINIHYRRTGGGKPPLICLHGLIASGACWAPVARRLESAWDVVMPDARGHGSSDAPPEGYGYRDHAGDVLGLIDALGLVRPVLLGHSMGGMTAALAACLAGPAVRGLILVDPTFISPEWQREVHASDIVDQHLRLLRSGKSELIAQARNRNPSRSLEIIEHLAEARLRTHPAAFDVLTPPNPPFRELISLIDAPILLVLAARGVVSLETAKELSALNPGLRHELVPDAGHGLPHDRPEALADLVGPFLRAMSTA